MFDPTSLIDCYRYFERVTITLYREIVLVYCLERLGALHNARRYEEHHFRLVIYRSPFFLSSSRVPVKFKRGTIDCFVRPDKFATRLVATCRETMVVRQPTTRSYTHVRAKHFGTPCIAPV